MARLGRDMRRHLDASEPDGLLRTGLSEGFGRTALPAALGILAREHRGLRFEALCTSSSATLFQALDRGDLDVAMTRRYTPWTEPTA